ncbi:MAG: hypothetical protein NVS4B8_14050 [Herpetosiphon sp.]
MGNRRRRWIRAWPLAALGMGAVLVADYTARQVSGVRRRTPGFTFTPTECGVPFEVVRFRTDDGIELCGWWLVQPHATRVLIGCTGHLGTKDELLGIGSGLWRAGNAVLLFDFRNRGESEVAPMSLAFREQDDLLAAVAYAKQRMGGAAPQIGVIGNRGRGSRLGIRDDARRVASRVCAETFAGTAISVAGRLYHAPTLRVSV